PAAPPRPMAAPPPCPPPPPPPPKWPPPPRCAKAAGAVPSNTAAQPATTSILVGFMAVLLTEGSASTSPTHRTIHRRVLVEWAVRVRNRHVTAGFFQGHQHRRP